MRTRCTAHEEMYITKRHAKEKNEAQQEEQGEVQSEAGGNLAVQQFLEDALTDLNDTEERNYRAFVRRNKAMLRLIQAELHEEYWTLSLWDAMHIFASAPVGKSRTYRQQAALLTAALQKRKAERSQPPE